MHSDRSKTQSTTFQGLETLEQRTLLSLSYVEFPMPSAGVPENSVFADFDSDGDVDLGGMFQFSEGFFEFGVTLSNGDGTFTATSFYPSEFGQLTVGDFDGDGAVDVIVGRFWSTDIFLGQGNGAFDTIKSTGFGTSGELWKVDFTADGVPDLIDDLEDGTFRLVRNTGTGWFQEGATHSFGLPDAEIIGVDDFNGDGIEDLAIYGSGSFQVWFGGGGDFTPGPISLIESKPAVGDFDGDGFADLAWSTTPFGSSTALVRRALNPGDGTFLSSSAVGTSPELLTQGVAQAIDIDGDSVLDLAFTWIDPNLTYFTSYSTRVVMYAGDGEGGFGVRVDLFSTQELSALQGAFRIQWEDISGDGVPDAFAFTPRRFGGAGQLFVSSASPPTIGSVSGPTGLVMPGSLLTIWANDVEASAGRTISAVRVFADSNGNGIYDNDHLGNGPDKFFGDATAGGLSPGQWRMAAIVPDDEFIGKDPPGDQTRMFVVAVDSRGTTSEAAAIDITFGYRIYFPEGWRSDATVSQTLTISNLQSFEVTYTIIARYETGERDGVIAQGVLTIREKKDIVISERGNPSAALVRGDVGYAIEVQTSWVVAASLLREESFASPGLADRVITVESLDNSAAGRWGFADVSTNEHDFLLFYNPFERDIQLTVTFLNGTADDIVINYRLDALRRGGLNVRQIAELVEGEQYGVEITSDDPFAAAISRYADGTAAGFSSLGQQYPASESYNWVRTGAAQTSTLELFNPHAQSISINVVVSYDDLLATVFSVIVSLEGGARETVDLSQSAPSDSTFGDIALTAGDTFYSQTTTTTAFTLHWDSVYSPSQTSHAWKQRFVSGSLNDGSTDWLVLSNRNDTTIRVDLHFMVEAWGDSEFVLLAPNQTVHINLNDLFFVGGLGRGPYDLHLDGEGNFIATLTHQNNVSGYAWQSMGTTMRRTTRL